MYDKNHKRFTFNAQILEQLEQTRHPTSNQNERAVATGFPPDTTEEMIRKFLQDVIREKYSKARRHKSGARQTQQPTPSWHSTRYSERNKFVKTLRRSQHQVGEGSRPIQFHEDPSWDGRSIHKQFGYGKCHIHRGINIGLSKIFADRKTISTKVKREALSKMEDRLLKCPNMEYHTSTS